MNEGLTPAQLNQRDIDRLRSYRELLDFYQGRHWEGHARWGETRLTFNYAKVIIDKITSYLMSGVTLAVDPVTDSAEARAPSTPMAQTTPSWRGDTGAGPGSLTGSRWRATTR